MSSCVALTFLASRLLLKLFEQQYFASTNNLDTRLESALTVRNRHDKNGRHLSLQTLSSQLTSLLRCLYILFLYEQAFLCKFICNAS